MALLSHLAYRGLSINPEVTHSVTQTKAQPSIPATVGTFDRLAFRIKSPLIWARSETLNVTGGIEYIQQNLVVPQFGRALPNNVRDNWRTSYLYVQI